MGSRARAEWRRPEYEERTPRSADPRLGDRLCRGTESLVKKQEPPPDCRLRIPVLPPRRSSARPRTTSWTLSRAHQAMSSAGRLRRGCARSGSPTALLVGLEGGRIRCPRRRRRSAPPSSSSSIRPATVASVHRELALDPGADHRDVRRPRRARRELRPEVQQLPRARMAGSLGGGDSAFVRWSRPVSGSRRPLRGTRWASSRVEAGNSHRSVVPPHTPPCSASRAPSPPPPPRIKTPGRPRLPAPCASPIGRETRPRLRPGARRPLQA